MRCLFSRSVQTFIASFLLLLLAACGPGTGGTGTGPVLSNAPAEETPSSGTQTPTSTPSAGVNPVGNGSAGSTDLVPSAAIWSNQSGTVVVKLISGIITVNANCDVSEFVGPWVSVDDLTQLKNSSGQSLKIKIIDSISMEVVISDNAGKTVFSANMLGLLPYGSQPISCSKP
jgi:hypothetical protein